MKTRTSVLLSEEEAEFIEEKGLGISTIAIIAIEKFLNGDMELPTLNAGSVKKSVWVPEELLGEIKKRNVSLSAVVRAEIRNLMKTMG